MSDRYGTHKKYEKYWGMEIEWLCQTGVVFRVMSDDWRKLNDNKKQIKQGFQAKSYYFREPTKSMKILRDENWVIM